jgi:hypothetical protein
MSRAYSSLRLESTGELQAEQSGFPLTDQGLTVVRHSQTLSADTTAAIGAAADLVIRRAASKKTRGHALGDGWSTYLQVREGASAREAGLSHLASWAEAGDGWRGLLTRVKAPLPNGFIE